MRSKSCRIENQIHTNVANCMVEDATNAEFFRYHFSWWETPGMISRILWYTSSTASSFALIWSAHFRSVDIWDKSIWYSCSMWNRLRFQHDISLYSTGLRQCWEMVLGIEGCPMPNAEAMLYSDPFWERDQGAWWNVKDHLLWWFRFLSIPICGVVSNPLTQLVLLGPFAHGCIGFWSGSCSDALFTIGTSTGWIFDLVPVIGGIAVQIFRAGVFMRDARPLPRGGFMGSVNMIEPIFVWNQLTVVVAICRAWCKRLPWRHARQLIVGGREQRG